MGTWLWRTVWAPLAVQTTAVPSIALPHAVTVHMLVWVRIRAGAVAVCVVRFALEWEGVCSGQNGLCGHKHLAVVTERQARCGWVELQGVCLLHLSKDLQDVCFLLEEWRQGLHCGGRSTRAGGGVLCAGSISLRTRRDHIIEYKEEVSLTESCSLDRTDTILGLRTWFLCILRLH